MIANKFQIIISVCLLIIPMSLGADIAGDLGKLRVRLDGLKTKLGMLKNSLKDLQEKLQGHKPDFKQRAETVKTKEVSSLSKQELDGLINSMSETSNAKVIFKNGFPQSRVQLIRQQKSVVFANMSNKWQRQPHKGGYIQEAKNALENVKKSFDLIKIENVRDEQEILFALGWLVADAFFFIRNNLKESLPSFITYLKDSRLSRFLDYYIFLDVRNILSEGFNPINKVIQELKKYHDVGYNIFDPVGKDDEGLSAIFDIGSEILRKFLASRDITNIANLNEHFTADANKNNIKLVGFDSFVRDVSSVIDKLGYELEISVDLKTFIFDFTHIPFPYQEIVPRKEGGGYVNCCFTLGDILLFLFLQHDDSWFNIDHNDRAKKHYLTSSDCLNKVDVLVENNGYSYARSNGGAFYGDKDLQGVLLKNAYFNLARLCTIGDQEFLSSSVLGNRILKLNDDYFIMSSWSEYSSLIENITGEFKAYGVPHLLENRLPIEGVDFVSQFEYYPMPFMEGISFLEKFDSCGRYIWFDLKIYLIKYFVTDVSQDLIFNRRGLTTELFSSFFDRIKNIPNFAFGMERHKNFIEERVEELDATINISSGDKRNELESLRTWLRQIGGLDSDSDEDGGDSENDEELEDDSEEEGSEEEDEDEESAEEMSDTDEDEDSEFSLFDQAE